MKAVGECVGRLPPGRSAAARGQRAAEHEHVVVDRLDRVVAAGEQIGVVARRRGRARRRRTAASRTCSGSARCRRSRARTLRQRLHQSRPRRRRSRPARLGSAACRAPRPCQTRTNSCMSRAARATETLPENGASVRAGGRRCPRLHVAETMAASKPASRETSTCARANAGLCWARASSTTPTSSVCRRGLLGLGGGGDLDRARVDRRGRAGRDGRSRLGLPRRGRRRTRSRRSRRRRGCRL